MRFGHPRQVEEADILVSPISILRKEEASGPHVPVEDGDLCKFKTVHL